MKSKTAKFQKYSTSHLDKRQAVSSRYAVLPSLYATYGFITCQIIILMD